MENNYKSNYSNKTGFAILNRTKDGDKILGKLDGEKLWFNTLDEVLEFMDENLIDIYQTSCIIELLNGFCLNTYNSKQIKNLMRERFGQYCEATYIEE